jgi:HTH-type transcriptional regulator / antitoxin HigA
MEDLMVQKPGDHVKALMQEMGWTQAELAYVMGVAPSTINQIVNSKSPITPETAKLLGVAFDRSAEEFADLQTKWSLENAPDPDRGVRERAFAQSNYPLRAMAKRGWIKSVEDGGGAHSELCRFFGVNSLENVAQMRHAAKKTTEGELTGEQLVWLYRVRQIAGEMMTPRYDRAKLDEAIHAFSSLRDDPTNVRLVPRLLEQAGVRFVVVEALPGSKIDGVCVWLDEYSPVIGLALRFDRIDNFWFVLRHECAHVLHGHGKDAAIVDYDMDADPTKSINDEERLADSEAADFCVSDDKMTSFYLRKRPFFAEREVLAFAKRNDVHPGLVVGQLQRRMGRYDFLRKHLVKVRDHLAGAMMIDGWGDLVPVD